MAGPLRAVVRALVAGAAPWPLYLWGPPGSGKTSAALVLLDHCGAVPPDGERPAVVTDWSAGLIDVRSLTGVRIAADKQRLAWSREGYGGAFSWDALLGIAGRVPLLAFDEIGVGREAGDFRLDVFLEVLDTRAGDPVRPFVLTGNVAPTDVAQVYDDRVASRVLCGTVFRLDGGDRRMPGKC